MGDPVEKVVTRAADGRISYPEKYAAYGRIYKRSGRTIRDWVSRGEEIGRLPPLHEPVAMVTWWKSHRSQKVPEGILEAAAAAGGAPVELELAGSAEESEESIVLDLEGEFSADQSLAQARALVALAFSKLQEAYKEGKPDKVERWRKDWKENSELLRKWEKDINRIREDRGELVRWVNVQSIVVEALGGVSRAYLPAMEALAEFLAPQMDRKERRKHCIRFRDRCFDGLQESEFQFHPSEPQ